MWLLTVTLLPECHLIYRTAWMEQAALNYKRKKKKGSILMVIAFTVQWQKAGKELFPW